MKNFKKLLIGLSLGVAFFASQDLQAMKREDEPNKKNSRRTSEESDSSMMQALKKMETSIDNFWSDNRADKDVAVELEKTVEQADSTEGTDLKLEELCDDFGGMTISSNESLELLSEDMVIPDDLELPSGQSEYGEEYFSDYVYDSDCVDDFEEMSSLIENDEIKNRIRKWVEEKGFNDLFEIFLTKSLNSCRYFLSIESCSGEELMKNFLYFISKMGYKDVVVEFIKEFKHKIRVVYVTMAIQIVLECHKNRESQEGLKGYHFEIIQFLATEFEEELDKSTVKYLFETAGYYDFQEAADFLEIIWLKKDVDWVLFSNLLWKFRISDPNGSAQLMLAALVSETDELEQEKKEEIEAFDFDDFYFSDEEI